jgi:hypothetical protein
MFDLARFRRLLNAHWAEQWRAHAWFLGIGVMVQFVVTLVILSGKPKYDTEAQEILFAVGLVLSAPLFAGRLFAGLARPEAALVFLMRPGSGLEKWLLAFLMVMVFYPLAYALAFQVCHLPAWLFEYARVQEWTAQILASGKELAPGEQLDKWVMWHPWRFSGTGVVQVQLVLLAMLQPFVLLGSLWFRRLPALKTVLVGFLVYLVTMGLTVALPTTAPWVGNLEMASAPWHLVHAYAWWIGIPVLLWLACYFAMRERELA